MTVAGDRKSLTQRSAALKLANATLRQQCRDLRDSLVTGRQQLRQERAKARTISRTLNDHLPGPQQKSALSEVEMAQVLSVRFLKVELQLCETFLSIARRAGRSSAKRARNLTNARLAYASLMKYQGETTMSKDDRNEIDSGMDRAKKALDQLVAEGPKR